MSLRASSAGEGGPTYARTTGTTLHTSLQALVSYVLNRNRWKQAAVTAELLRNAEPLVRWLWARSFEMVRPLPRLAYLLELEAERDTRSSF
jgi:hypothetical protein